MTEASADPTPETIIVTYDYTYPRSKPKGKPRFQLREDSAVHSCGAGMATWSVDPGGRTTGVWRPGAREKIRDTFIPKPWQTRQSGNNERTTSGH